MFTPDFEKEILKAVIRDERFLQLLPHLNSRLFLLDETKIVYNSFTSFYDKYKTIPTKVELEQYLLQTQQDHLKDENIKAVNTTLIQCYSTDYQSSEYLTDQIMKFVISKKTQEAISSQDTAFDLDSIKSLKDKLESIMIIPDSFNHNIEFFCKDFSGIDVTSLRGIPSKFPSVDKCLSSKGFMPGEIVVFLSTAKAGKTTLMVNFVEGYIKNGLKVLYVDTENGKNRMHRLFWQNLLRCSIDELRAGYFVREYVKKDPLLLKKFQNLEQEWLDNHNRELYAEMLEKYVDLTEDVLRAILNNINSMGGDIVFQFLSPQSKTDEVEKYLLQLKNHGFKPDVVVVDYFDNFMPSKSVHAEKRSNIQDVYLNFKALANKYQFVCFTPSQTNRGGVGKEMLDETFLAEDYQKAAHANYIYAFVRTEEHRKNNKGVIKLVIARDGSDICGPIELDCEMNNVCINEVSQIVENTIASRLGERLY